MSSNSNRKYKKPKRSTGATTNPQASKRITRIDDKNSVKPKCPLLAKDSEWLDGLQGSSVDSPGTMDNVSDEEVLQLVECEDGPEMKPLTIMFPGILEKDPQILEDMLNKRMSTTEVTKHLLGQKADFSLMKKVRRLIPSDKKWLETLSEDGSSISSEIQQGSYNASESNQSNGCNETAEKMRNIKLSLTDVKVPAAQASTSDM